MIYTVHDEIGRGRLCIAYEASYINNVGISKKVFIKECYPFKLRICRDENGRLIPDESDSEKFYAYKKYFQESFEINNTLFEISGLSNFIVNFIDLYEANNTLYIVSSYLEGATLSARMPVSLKEVITVTKSAAKAIKKIHNSGYLYLDVKPENIFVLEGTAEIVQLFDFDSLIPLNRKSEITDYKISYSKGFSPVEQRTGKLKTIGKYTDIYGIGALLFYLVFGRTPGALECDMDFKYEYFKAKYSMDTYRDKLQYALTDFFHHTLASCYLDRYQDMNDVLTMLDEIESYADCSLPFICDSYVSFDTEIIGREEEIKELEQWYYNTDETCIFVTGMGGIGKSTLVRQFITKNRLEFDTILYLHFKNSIQNTIADDECLCVNTVEKTEEESLEDYFRRKLITIRKIIAGKTVIIVIDDFDGEIRDDLLSILNAGWKVIIITRVRKHLTEYKEMDVGPLRERRYQHCLFAKCIGQEFREEQTVAIDKIINKVLGHTLTLELIAKQIAKSYFTVEKAVELVEQYGFANLASERIDYVKDGKVYYEKISNIITALFAVKEMSLEKKIILKALSLFDSTGINISTLGSLLRLNTKDAINKLNEEGWINIDRNILSLHPVVRETIQMWIWIDEYQEPLCGMLSGIYKQIKAEEQCEHISARMRKYLNLSEYVLNSCKKEISLYNTGIYKRLLYYTVKNMPRDRESYILLYAEELLHDVKYIKSHEAIKLYNYVSYILCNRREFKEAYKKIMKAKKIAEKEQDAYVWGIYYEALADYYDALIDGEYYAQEKSKVNMRYRLIMALDKAIYYMKKTGEPDGKQCLIKYLLSKAAVLIRSFPEERKEIQSIIASVRKLMRETMPDSLSLKTFYNIVCAWYYTLVRPVYENTVRFTQAAYDTAKDASTTDLNDIDDIIVPCANIMAEWGDNDEAVRWLNIGVEVCQYHKDSLPYIRKKMNLYKYLLDVYRISGNREQYHVLIETINLENRKNKDIGIYKESDDYLQEEL